MRLLNNDSNEKIDGVTIYMTKDEVLEMIDSLTSLIKNASAKHFHVYSADHKKEVILCLYENGDVSQFNERSRRLIVEDQ